MIGAGASFGCGKVLPEAPPLGDRLYKWLRGHFPKTWGTISGPLHDRFEIEGFELGMHDAWTTYSDHTQNLLIDMARAFARFKPPSDASDLYTRLLRGLVANRQMNDTVFVSLNYECILELAGVALELQVDYGSKSRPNAVVILKPHGSCNLLPDMGSNIVRNVQMTGVGQFFEGPVKPVPLADVQDLAHNSIPPAMALYAPGKPAPVAKAWIDATRSEWRRLAADCVVIAIIGVRPIWADTHLWEPVISSSARVWYIGGKADYEELALKLDGRVDHLGETFDKGIGPLIDRLGDIA